MKSLKHQNAILIGVAAVVIIGGWLFFRQPTRVVEGAAQKLSMAQSGAFKVTVQLENVAATKQILGEPGTVELELEGVFDRRGDERDALQADFRLTPKTDSISVTLDGELRLLDDKIFLLLKTVPPVFGLAGQLKGQWLEIPRGEEETAATVELPEDLFTQVKRVGSEEIDGHQVTKYTAQAQEAAVVRFMDGLAALIGTRLTNEQVANIRQGVAQIKQVPVELWVGRSDLKQMAAELNVPNGNTVHVRLAIPETNQDVSIEAPEKAVLLPDALKTISQNAQKNRQ